MGHTNCGAINFSLNKRESNPVDSVIVGEILTLFKDTKNLDEISSNAFVNNLTQMNLFKQSQKLLANLIINSKLRHGLLRLYLWMYVLHSGKFELVKEVLE